MHPLDRPVHYGEAGVDLYETVQGELLPDKVQQLRRKLNQKASNEPKFRFYALYDRLYRPDVLEAAWRHVGRRGKAAGVDGVRAEQLLDRPGAVQAFLADLHEQLRTKGYRADPVKRVYIDKADGRRRPLGIPTLKDRVVQMAALLILEPIFEADFRDCSYGFRPGRQAHQALDAIRAELKAGRRSVFDADLQGYFDSIAHDKLMACVRMRVVDRSVLKLIRDWLRAPVVEQDDQGRPRPPRRRERGTPQGGVISPLLANVYLHWFDVMFHRPDGPYHWAGARLVRYADDFVVLARYQSGRLQEWIRYQVEDWLDLRLNREKTRIVELGDQPLDFLGFTLRYDRDLKGRNWRYLNVMPSKKSLGRARAVIREKTGPRQCYKPTSKLVAEVNRYLRGWQGYFQYGYPRKPFRDLGHYTRERMKVHLNRRSQRKYHRPEGMSHYRYLQHLGLIRL